MTDVGDIPTMTIYDKSELIDADASGGNVDVVASPVTTGTQPLQHQRIYIGANDAIDSGSFRISADGATTNCIDHDADENDISTELATLAGITSATVAPNADLSTARFLCLISL